MDGNLALVEISKWDRRRPTGYLYGVKPMECFISREKGGVRGGKELKQRVQRGFHYRRTENLFGQVTNPHTPFFLKQAK